MRSPRTLYEIPMPQAFLPSRFFMAFRPFSEAAHQTATIRDVSCCSIRNTSSTLVGWRPASPRPGADTGTHVRRDRASVRTLRRDAEPQRKLRVNRLIEAGAWTDATLALVELELPQWKLRGIVYEDGEWHCCLSRQPQLPLGLDEVAEASHEILPLAILIAFLQARRAARRERDGSYRGSAGSPRSRARHVLRQFA